MKTTIDGSSFSDSKKHYLALDGLRGVAAIMVVLMHLCETFINESTFREMYINHGYLAVDFFFLLSGFVIGYAYDDRWGKMSLGGFFKRRLIRLHPLIILGMILGAIAFYFQQGDYWSGIADVPVWYMLLVMLIGCTLIPLPLFMDIRGWQEMHPLDGTAWSLFFEYVANILYALFVRKFSNTVLAICAFIAGTVLIQYAVTSPNGDIIGGWSLEPTQLRLGFTRMLYPFLAGLLLSRLVKPVKIKNAFLWCSLAIIIILSLPRIGSVENTWINGLYDSLMVIIVFPIIVYIGASDVVKGKITTKVCTFLGAISYPLYITHYPLMYTYTAWVKDNNIPMSEGWIRGLLVLFISIGIAYLSLKLYDIPVRKWLSKKL